MFKLKIIRVHLKLFITENISWNHIHKLNINDINCHDFTTNDKYMEFKYLMSSLILSIIFKLIARVL